ncbi:MAG: CDP-alcohol phosphatidyltransferase family protein [Alphaproteobacteria bacterium]|nr:CDP-alcohol phosphatidyltransferase family protein [Alphaproteobacteria bacterium]
MKRLPNIISLLRILVVPIVIWLIVVDYWEAAFWVFLAAGISDAVDGFIAERFDAVSQVGVYLDPLADKVLLVAVFVALGTTGLMPLWLVILVVSRDVLIVGGVLFSVAVSLPLTLRASGLSKANTFAQIVLAAIVLGVHGFIWPLDVAVELMTYIVGALTAVSGGYYVMHWSRVAFRDGAGA